MGMYTELIMATRIQNNQDVIPVIEYMIGESDIKPNLPEHPLFKTRRWEYMLRCDSAYFSGTTHSELECNNLGSSVKLYYLTIRTNLKNYDNEIDHFLNWLSPYMETDGFLGYTRYEEDDLPTLIFNDNGNIRYEQAVTKGYSDKQ